MAGPRIHVNGDEQALVAGTTVASLIERLALPRGRVAVERNGDVVPRAAWAETTLTDGDRLEVVTFVGGG